MSDTDPIIPDEIPATTSEQLQLAELIQRHCAECSLDFADDPDFTNDRRDLGAAIEVARCGNNTPLVEVLNRYIHV